MSVTFYGRKADGKQVDLSVPGQEGEYGEDLLTPFFNLANGNARSFLTFLGLPADEYLEGEATVPECRRAIIAARATFDRKVDHHTRPATDTKRPGQVRVIDRGTDRDYYRRIVEFETFVLTLAENGATTIYWN
jgi:hypothetical protein